MSMIATKLNPATLRTTTSWLTALSVLPHLLCCGIPVVVALLSLGTTVGLAASLVSNPFYMFVDAWHRELIIVAVCSVLVSGLFNYIAWRMDCHADAKASLVQGHCGHGDCTPKKRASFKLFFISLALLVLDLTWFYTEGHVLGLHNHSHEAVATPSHDDHGHQHE